MYILIAPLEVVNDSFVSQLPFDNENILKELNNSLIDVEMVKFSDHRFLVFKILFVRIYKCVSLIYNWSDIVENLSVKCGF